jgi:D-alanyl-D-alanine carboxypeptidase (penicillin-binding protein 5/6)
MQPPPVLSRPLPPPATGALAGVVIDGGSGAVLWGKDEHRPLPPASTTKIITVLLAVEQGNLDEPVRADVDDRRFDIPTRMGLVRGDVFPLRDLLYGALLPSGNDAAITIAYHLAGSELAFAALMNRRMCELGLTDSSFVNSSGLGRGESNVASAYDLAQVSRYALDLPAFAEIVRTRTWTAHGTRVLTLTNLNELLAWYPGADGVKIGWTPGAGNTIVASATRNGHRVIVALLNTPNRAAESAALLDWAFAAHTWGQ